VHLVVNEWKVSSSWTLTDSSELVIHRTVTQANPSLVGSEIRHWDASQVSANGRAAENRRVTGIGNGGLGLLIKLGGGWKSIGLVNLGLGETSNEDELSIPRSLEYLTWWELRNIKLLVSVTNVPASSDHLSVDNGDQSLDSKAVVSKDETLNHVHLSTADFVVTVLLIPDSVLVEPVVGLGLNIERVTEVGWAGRGHPESVPVLQSEAVDELLVLSLIVILHDSKVPHGTDTDGSTGHGALS